MTALLTGREQSLAFATRFPVAFITHDRMYANNTGKLDEANGWVETAQPLIAAYLTVYDLHDAAYADDSYAGREVRDVYRAAQERLYAEIEATRDDAIGDAQVGLQDDDDAQECADAFNDWLSDNTTTVQAALNTVRMNRSSTLENRRDA